MHLCLSFCLSTVRVVLPGTGKHSFWSKLKWRFVLGQSIRVSLCKPCCKVFMNGVSSLDNASECHCVSIARVALHHENAPWCVAPCAGNGKTIWSTASWSGASIFHTAVKGPRGVLEERCNHFLWVSAHDCNISDTNFEYFFNICCRCFILSRYLVSIWYIWNFEMNFARNFLSQGVKSKELRCSVCKLPPLYWPSTPPRLKGGLVAKGARHYVCEYLHACSLSFDRSFDRLAGKDFFYL